MLYSTAWLHSLRRWVQVQVHLIVNYELFRERISQKHFVALLPKLKLYQMTHKKLTELNFNNHLIYMTRVKVSRYKEKVSSRMQSDGISLRVNKA